MADAGDRLVGVVGVHDGEVARAAHLVQIRIRQQEEVRHHQIGKPELLQLRQAVKDIQDALALLLDDAVDKHREALKADVRVELIHLRVRAAGCHGLGVHHQLVLRETEIDDPLPRAGHAHDKLGGSVHIVRQVVDLPDHVFPRPERVDGVVQTVQTGADACLFLSSLFPWFVLFHRFPSLPCFVSFSLKKKKRKRKKWWKPERKKAREKW